MKQHSEITILAPCYNEGETVIRFLENLESVLGKIQQSFNVIIVNDNSLDNTLTLLQKHTIKSPNIKLVILDLPYNQGHQRAIHQGILHAVKLNSKQTIIMDSDGEDSPEAIPKLLEHSEQDVVFVERGKRSEGIVFKLAYTIYRVIFKLLVGQSIRFGNFCMINQKVMQLLTNANYVHLPAFLLKQKLRKSHIIVNRGERIGGTSKMSYSSLILHGFNSMVEFAEELLLTFLKLFILVMIVFCSLIGFIVYHKLISGLAIPGWASTFSIGLLNMALISFGFFIVGILVLNIAKRKDFASQKPIYQIINND